MKLGVGQWLKCFPFVTDAAAAVETFATQNDGKFVFFFLSLSLVVKTRNSFARRRTVQFANRGRINWNVTLLQVGRRKRCCCNSKRVNFNGAVSKVQLVSSSKVHDTFFVWFQFVVVSNCITYNNEKVSLFQNFPVQICSNFPSKFDSPTTTTTTLLLNEPDTGGYRP